MRKEQIRDKNNRMIGWCDDIGTQISAIHIRKGFVGMYVKSSDMTLEKSGKVYCYGDGCQSLIRDAEAGRI